jgi:hypothetical protein
VNGIGFQEGPESFGIIRDIFGDQIKEKGSQRKNEKNNNG